MTDPIGVFSGIASGIDFRELIDSVIALERRPIDRLQQRIDYIDVKQSAFNNFRTLLDNLQTTSESLSDGSAFDAVLTASSGLSSLNTPLFSAVGGPGATPGQYAVEVLALAQTEKVSGNQYADTSTALGISGEFTLNGRLINITATDTLTAVRDKINQANGGPTATGVTATILSTGTGGGRLILTADQSGAAGINLADTSSGVVSQLGLVDGTTSIRNPNSSGADSARFASDTDTVSSMIGFTGTIGPQTVTVAGQNVSIDLDTESLTDIAANLSALTGVTATVASSTDANGNTEYYLDIRGTTSFTDSGNALEVLGVLEQGRGAVAHQVTGATLASDAGGTPATTSTLLTALFQNGASTSTTVGDTFTVSGTRGDGSAVSLTYTVGAGDTVQDFLDALNDNVTGFGAGSRPATASIDASGAIVLTDGTAGDSLLGLSVVAHNEGGGTIDLGTFADTVVGRAREISAGADASVRIDGITITRTSNTITDAIDDVTLNLLTAEAGKVGTISITRSTDEAANTLQTFVDQYNELVTFIKDQLVVGEDEALPPLYGDSALRNTRSSIVDIFLGQVLGAASDLNTMASVGLELNRDGTLKLDTSVFTGIYESRFNDIQDLFMEQGSATDPEVQFVSSAGTAAAGTYAVDITTAATRAGVTGAGFSGTYVDDATADTMTVTDALSGAAASIQLSNGMTTQNIVDALNAEFDASYQHELTSGTALYSDPSATTAVTLTTTLSDIHDSGGVNAGIIAGDTIDFAGVRADGTNFSSSFAVTDPTTNTVGDVVAAIQAQYGAGATVSLVNGAINVQATNAGPSALDLTLTENNEGGGTLDFGVLGVTVTGRNSMGIDASVSGSDVVLTHASYGSAPGFDVAYTPGGTDGTAQLGIGAASYNGVDVVGTIGGFAATGTGQQLVGDVGSSVAGLHVSYTGTTARSAGDVNLTVGSGASLERLFDRLFEVGTGLLDSRDQSYNDQIARIGDRMDRLESRVARREAVLIRKFTAMEVLMGQLQAQSSALASQIQSLIPTGGG